MSFSVEDEFIAKGPNGDGRKIAVIDALMPTEIAILRRSRLFRQTNLSLCILFLKILYASTVIRTANLSQLSSYSHLLSIGTLDGDFSGKDG